MKRLMTRRVGAAGLLIATLAVLVAMAPSADAIGLTHYGNAAFTVNGSPFYMNFSCADDCLLAGQHRGQVGVEYFSNTACYPFSYCDEVVPVTVTSDTLFKQVRVQGSTPSQQVPGQSWSLDLTFVVTSSPPGVDVYPWIGICSDAYVDAHDVADAAGNVLAPRGSPTSVDDPSANLYYGGVSAGVPVGGGLCGSI